MTLDKSRLDSLQGTLDLLILRALRNEVTHGWAISERIQQISQDGLQVHQGSLYPALHRLEDCGWIKVEWVSPNWVAAPASTRLLPQDASSLKWNLKTWNRLTDAIARVLRMAGYALA